MLTTIPHVAKIATDKGAPTEPADVLEAVETGELRAFYVDGPGHGYVIVTKDAEKWIEARLPDTDGEPAEKPCQLGSDG